MYIILKTTCDTASRRKTSHSKVAALKFLYFCTNFNFQKTMIYITKKNSQQNQTNLSCTV